jgi:hypothetical protein
MSDKEERKISLEKRRQMLANLEKARATRAKNLAAKKDNIIIDEKKEEKKEEKEPVVDIDEETPDSKLAPPEIKHQCLCGRKYVRKDGLFRHQEKCKVWLEERAEDAEQEEEIAEIKAEREAAEKKAEPKKKRAKKVKMVVKEPEPEESENEEEKEVKPKPIPEPAPPKKKNIVPSAEPKYHNGQEPLEKYTMEEWRIKHEQDKLARYEQESRKKFEEQEDRINRLKKAMMAGGI